MSEARAVAFAPGRANLIGEHTDYNDGLSLPFAIDRGVTATAVATQEKEIVVTAGERGPASFALCTSRQAAYGDWRDFVRGAIAELRAAGVRLGGARVELDATVPEGGGLSSSAALEVALCLALLALTGGAGRWDPIDLARLCSRIENEWVGAQTGLLDQLTSLLGREGQAILIDFRTLETVPVPLDLGKWRLIAVDSGEQHALTESGYNERRRECEQARELLGIVSLRDASDSDARGLPDPLGRRVTHVLDENRRVRKAVRALESGRLDDLAALMNASHRSLRDLYEASTDAVEATVQQLLRDGAAAARMMGGGFGGSVIALLPAQVTVPEDAVELRPSAGARVLE